MSGIDDAISVKWQLYYYTDNVTPQSATRTLLQLLSQFAKEMKFDIILISEVTPGANDIGWGAIRA